MFRAFFIFAAPAIVLLTEATLGFSFGNIPIVGTFVAKFKINFPGKERVHWKRDGTLYTRPQGHLRFQDGERAVYSDRSDSLVIVGREIYVSW